MRTQNLLPWAGDRGEKPVDALTNPVVHTSSPLWSTMTDNRIDLNPIGWASISKNGLDEETDNRRELAVRPSGMRDQLAGQQHNLRCDNLMN